MRISDWSSDVCSSDLQTLSSARRTCIDSVSAVEWTATVAMPRSRHARWMRSAISPRFAIRILRNTGAPFGNVGGRCSLDDHQQLAEFERRAVGDEDLRDRAGAWRRDLVHDLHRLDDEQRVAFRDPVRSEEHTSEL